MEETAVTFFNPIIRMDNPYDSDEKPYIIRKNPYNPDENKKAPSRTRTGDLRITNASLYQLSHGSLPEN